MPNLPVGGSFGTSELGQGWLNVNLGLTCSQRNYMHSGSDRTMNPDNERTHSRIYTIDASFGIWRGLAMRMTLPMLDVWAYSDSEGSVREFGLGDSPLVLSYLFQSKTIPPTWKFNLGAGAYLPTGAAVQMDIPSNPNFVSGTVDPLLTLDVAYDFPNGFGLFAHSFSRFVLTENEKKYRAANSFSYGAGARLRYFGSLVFAFGVNGVHRGKDEIDGVADEMTGGDFLYATPTFSYLFTKGKLTGLSFVLAGQIPLYQRVNQMQLAEDFNVSFSLGYGVQLYGD